jgi:cytidylate kinase
VAENAAASLGYHLSDYKVAESILREYGLAQFRNVYGTAPDIWDFFSSRGQDRHQVNSMLRRCTTALAKHGNVVMLGRGCFMPLQGFSDVLNVHLQAPLPVRIDRIMERQKLTHDEAEAFVKEKDALVSGFLKSAYKRAAHDTRLFDLVIDTSKSDLDAVVRYVVETAGNLKAAPKAGDPNPGSENEAGTAGIRVDPILAMTVSKQLGCEAAHNLA